MYQEPRLVLRMAAVPAARTAVSSVKDGGHPHAAGRGPLDPPQPERPAWRGAGLRVSLLGVVVSNSNTSEAGVAADHVRARGQPRPQQQLCPGVALLTLGGRAVAPSVLLVNPAICFICRRQAEWAKVLFPPISLRPVTGKPKAHTIAVTRKSHFQLLPPT